jgi:hypothetical protein
MTGGLYTHAAEYHSLAYPVIFANNHIAKNDIRIIQLLIELYKHNGYIHKPGVAGSGTRRATPTCALQQSASWETNRADTEIYPR